MRLSIFTSLNINLLGSKYSRKFESINWCISSSFLSGIFKLKEWPSNLFCYFKTKKMT